MNYKDSPCHSCTRVKDPEACEYKACKEWRAWFAAAWDHTRGNPRLQKELRKAAPKGVNICGRNYILPDRVREYLADSPCKTCPLPEGFCTSPCPAYRAWEETRNEVEL